MHFLTRPSKSFLFDYLQSLLQKEKGDVGVDAAADRLRNRHMFKTKFYYGIDKNKEALVRGLRSNPEENVYAIEGDLINLGGIPDGSADVVLSSNTLYQIPASIRGDAVKELCRITASNGVFIAEFTKDEDFQRMLSVIRDNFASVRVVYFKNQISRAYEGLAYGSDKKERRIFATKPMRLVSWIISRLEYLTKGVGGLNAHAIVIARDKTTGNEAYAFDVTRLKRLDDRLYSTS